MIYTNIYNYTINMIMKIKPREASLIKWTRHAQYHPVYTYSVYTIMIVPKIFTISTCRNNISICLGAEGIGRKEKQLLKGCVKWRELSFEKSSPRYTGQVR